jgi:hypothetical protein
MTTSAHAWTTLIQLPGFKQTSKTQWEARCPGHDDRKSSLCISSDSTGKILLKCQAGCNFDHVCMCARIDPKDLFPANGNVSKPTISEAYSYETLEGQLSFQVVRLEPKDFRQRRPDGKGGWIWDTKGIKRIPYNLQELVACDYPLIVEGEKDVESLRKIGRVATCNAGGAGKWTDELSQYFSNDQQVVILPDNDSPGRKHADQVARSLTGKVASIKILELPGLPDKGDVSDWLQGRNSDQAREELFELEKAAPEWKPVTEAEKQDKSITALVKTYVESIEGVFMVSQLYSDLGIRETQDKNTARHALARLKGTLVQPHGNKSGQWRVISGECNEIDFSKQEEVRECNIWLPLDLHNYVSIMPGNIIVVTGDPDSGKTAFLLNVIKRNLDRWDIHYFNSEMGKDELRKRLQLFSDFPMTHKNFHAYERSNDFQDVVKPGIMTINIIDYLEVTDEFYLIGKYINDIHRALEGALCIIAIQKKDRNSDMPLGKERALEKPRLAIALTAGSQHKDAVATIIKCKNRKTEHSMLFKKREYKLVQGSEFKCHGSEWI